MALSYKRELAELRKRIDHIDDKLLALLGSRAAISLEVSKLKLQAGIACRDQKREEELVSRLVKINPSNLLHDQDIEDIWQAVISVSRRVQRRYQANRVNNNHA